MKHVVSIPFHILSNPKQQEYEGQHIKGKYNQSRHCDVQLIIEADTVEEVEAKIRKMFKTLLTGSPI